MIHKVYSESESPNTAKLSLFFSLTVSAGFAPPPSENLLEDTLVPPSEKPIAGDALFAFSTGGEAAGAVLSDMEKLDNLGAGFGGGASPSAVARIKSAAEGRDG